MKTAILTGANGQLGKEFLRVLIDAQYFVYAVDKETHNITPSEHVKPVKLDITDENQVKVFYSELVSVDVLINNAGAGVFSPFEDRTAKEFRMVMDVNLLGTFLMAQGAIVLMKNQGAGKVINIGSIYGVKSSDERIYGDSGRNNSEVYSVTKAGVIQLTRYMAAHFGKYNIQTNCISPGGIYNKQSDDFVTNFEYKTPAGRMGEPKDISNALMFLCSRDTEYVNGQNIVVDGGFVAW